MNGDGMRALATRALACFLSAALALACFGCSAADGNGAEGEETAPTAVTSWEQAAADASTVLRIEYANGENFNYPLTPGSDETVGKDNEGSVTWTGSHALLTLTKGKKTKVLQQGEDGEKGGTKYTWHSPTEYSSVGGLIAEEEDGQ